MPTDISVKFFDTAYSRMHDLYGVRRDLVIGKNRHLGSLGDIRTYLTYAPQEYIDTMNGVVDDFRKEAFIEGFKSGKNQRNRNRKMHCLLQLRESRVDSGGNRWLWTSCQGSYPSSKVRNRRTKRNY